jgi:hypothetical protein
MLPYHARKSLELRARDELGQSLLWLCYLTEGTTSKARAPYLYLLFRLVSPIKCFSPGVFSHYVRRMQRCDKTWM